MPKLYSSQSVPSWAHSMIDNFRLLALVPDTVNDITLFVAIDSNDILALNYEDQVPAVYDALGIKWEG
jgi:hypothetical protein